MRRRLSDYLVLVAVAIVLLYVAGYLKTRSAFGPEGVVFFNKSFKADRILFFGFYPAVVLDRMLKGTEIIYDAD